jgi:hypothetical protein
VREGDTFLLADQTKDDHLWFVLSDPAADPENVLITNLTTWAPWKDQNLVLDVGDHPWIRHKTCIYFRGAQIIANAKLDKLVAGNKIVPQDPLKPAILDKIRLAARDTKELKGHFSALLDKQGLLGF